MKRNIIKPTDKNALLAMTVSNKMPLNSKKEMARTTIRMPIIKYGLSNPKKKANTESKAITKMKMMFCIMKKAFKPLPSSFLKYKAVMIEN